MPWNIKNNSELSIIEIIYKGTLTHKDTRDAAQKAISLASPNGQLILADALETESKLSALDIYSEPRLWADFGASRKNKMAIVAHKDTKTWLDANFYETTSRNQGWNLRLFTDRKKAIDWLSETVNTEDVPS